MFLEAAFLCGGADDGVGGGGNGLAKGRHLGVRLSLARLLGKLCVGFDHVCTGGRSGDLSALPGDNLGLNYFERLLDTLKMRPVWNSSLSLSSLPLHSSWPGKLFIKNSL